MRTQPNLNGYSVGRKIITQNIAPHLDIDFDEPIDCRVKRNSNNDALLKIFEERDIILLADFARYTLWPYAAIGRRLPKIARLLAIRGCR